VRKLTVVEIQIHLS